MRLAPRVCGTPRVQHSGKGRSCSGRFGLDLRELVAPTGAQLGTTDAHAFKEFAPLGAVESHLVGRGATIVLAGFLSARVRAVLAVAG